MEKQLYLIASSMTGLLLGAAISEQKSLNSKMHIKNKALFSANEQLQALVDKNQRLAHKIVNVQEEERKTLSRELHDEIGQNMTALKVNLKVIRKLIGHSDAIPLLDSIDKIANTTYQSVYDLMYWLRPRVVDDLGLEKRHILCFQLEVFHRYSDRLSKVCHCGTRF